MALRSLSLSLARRTLPAPVAATTTTLCRRPPRSLHHQDNKLGGTTLPKTEAPTGRRWGNYFEYDPPQNFDELVKRYEERRSFDRMMITVAVPAYCIALFIVSSMRNSVKEKLRKQ
uniref:Uncharacterized protein n=1 Tax=Oryza punctata TaxID=4537 RepID=A0A0E0LGT2_ORYPU